MSPELEAQLAMLSSHRSVLGYMLLSRGHPASIIRHSGVIFEGEQGRKYATVIGRIVGSVQGGLEEIHVGETDGVRYASLPVDGLYLRRKWIGRGPVHEDTNKTT